ncbi:MAG: zinc ABC transporter substrate-binding protein, partial [Bacilli bacterium]|nr:zinc ABC transporter substrate-binding protein [Bacilli bacterium]
LAGKIDELGLHSVLTIEGNDHRIAETVVANTTAKNQKILTMDSLQSTTSAQVKEGVNYLSVMTENLNILKEALK